MSTNSLKKFFAVYTACGAVLYMIYYNTFSKTKNLLYIFIMPILQIIDLFKKK